MKKKHKKLNIPLETIEKAKEESLKDIKGVQNYAGSSYNGKGNVDHAKITSNKKRR